MTAAAPIRRVGDWVKRLGIAILDLHRRGVSMVWLAPLVLALVVVPEFVQHVAEITLGMFDSREQAAAIANDPRRWAFGYAKLAGLLLTFLAAARFWWTREHGGHWWDLRGIAWGRLLLGLLMFGGVPLLAELLEPLIGKTAKDVATWVLTLATLPFLLLLLAGLFGDRGPSLRRMWTHGWPSLLMLCVLLPLAFAPAQWLHGLNHQWAMGGARPVIWALMIWDSLLVGLLAGLVGTAFFLGYAAFRRAAG